MKGVNLCTFIGTVGHLPELRRTVAGKPVLNFSIGVDDEWLDGDGQPHRRCEFVNIAIFGRAADDLARVLLRGDLVHVVGRMRTESYGRPGERRTSTKIIAECVLVLCKVAPARAGDGASGPQQALDALERVVVAGTTEPEPAEVEYRGSAYEELGSR